MILQFELPTPRRSLEPAEVDLLTLFLSLPRTERQHQFADTARTGDPEIYATYSFVDNQGIKGQYHMGGVNNTGTWYTINGPLFYWQSYYGNTLAMAIWEKDGTNWGTFSYSFSGFTFSVTINDGDDQLGANPVSFFDPACGYYSTGDAEYKMRYQAP